MKSIQEVYPQCQEDDYFSYPSDYRPLLESFGYEILIQIDDHDYQGDSRLLYFDEGRYGILVFGWGSCSGCDSLQACSSYEDIDELRDRLFHEIKWFDNASDCLEYFEKHDWEGDFSWHDEEMKVFLEDGKELIKKRIEEQKS